VHKPFTQIMYDFFGCRDAMVLDEGYDVFFVNNPNQDNKYRYTNDELLARVSTFTKQRAKADVEEARRASADYPLGPEMASWPLNRAVSFDELLRESDDSSSRDFSDIMLVTPNRSQMRSVLIFAVREASLHQGQE